MKLIRLGALVVVLNAAHVSTLSADEGAAVKGDAPQRNEQELQFEKKMSGAVLVGHFTTSGEKPGEKLKEERYTIRKVAKVAGKENVWRFFVRIQYGELDLTVPMNLEVYWAAKTPVITLTDLTIPALGTFSARVLVYESQYAGTWQHGEVGGHLFGHIEREKKPEAETNDSN
ncbi:MAG: hypothetical protein WBF93_04060 [Pirellulales bacterium]|nr:hypothetical protein [Pirellulales bacterium]